MSPSAFFIFSGFFCVHALMPFSAEAQRSTTASQLEVMCKKAATGMSGQRQGSSGSLWDTVQDVLGAEFAGNCLTGQAPGRQSFDGARHSEAWLFVARRHLNIVAPDTCPTPYAGGWLPCKVQIHPIELPQLIAVEAKIGTTSHRMKCCRCRAVTAGP